MPLKLQLRPGEKVIINSAVLEAPQHGRTEISVLNQARIMREAHIMQRDDANTPAKRLYFCLQMLYIEPEREEEFFKLYEHYYKDLKDTVTLRPLVEALDNIDSCMKDGKNVYGAMKLCRSLIKAEAELLKIALPEGFDTGEGGSLGE